MISSSFFRGYQIDIVDADSGNGGSKFIVKDKQGNLLIESQQAWPFPTEAEMQAKLYINRIIMKQKGFIIT